MNNGKKDTEVLIIGRGYLGTLLNLKLESPSTQTSLLKFREDAHEQTKFIFLASGPSAPTVSLEELQIWKRKITKLVNTLQEGVLEAHLIYLSSAGTVYGECTGAPPKESSPLLGVTNYAKYQLWTEKQLAALKEIPVTILRVTNPYGPVQISKVNQGFISACIRSIKTDEVLSLYGNGRIARDYIHESDLVTACQLIINNPKKRVDNEAHIYNISTGILTTQQEVIEVIYDTYKMAPEISYLGKRGSDLTRSCADSTKFQRDYFWKPEFELTRGIETYKEYLCKL